MSARTPKTVPMESGAAGELSVVVGATYTCEEVPLPRGCERVPETGPRCMGWVCCIFTVALGRAGALLFGASLGTLMRAVSFFGCAGLATMPEGAAGAATGGGGVLMPLGGPGRSGTVGLPVSGGGFGGGTEPLSGLVAGAEGGIGGGVIGGGVTPAGADDGGGAEIPLTGGTGGSVILEVSFFGVWPKGWLCVPGTLMRTVSRFTAGASPFGGKVMRMVSFFVESSS